MSNNTEVWEDGVLRQFWDADSTPRMYYEYDANGNLTLEREFTVQENSSTDYLIQDALNAEAAQARRAAVKLIVTDLKVEKDRVQAVLDKTNAQITPSDTKDVARAAKRIADAAIDLARLLTE